MDPTSDQTYGSLPSGSAAGRGQTAAERSTERDAPASTAAGPKLDGGSDVSIAERRARMKRIAALGKRIGWLLILATVVIFIAGQIAGVKTWMPPTVGVAFALAGIIMIPATIVGYGVRAAERDERDERARTQAASATSGP